LILLEHGDRLPTVALIQILLNAYTPADSSLLVDGIFGRATEAAVRTFQRTVMRTAPSGQIDSRTWVRLAQEQHLQVRDLVDITDPLINQMADVVRAEGSNPIVRGGGSNAVADIVPSIAASGVRRGTLALLRFQGHGNRGVQVVGYGTGCHVYYDIMHQREVPPLEQCIAERASVTPEDAAVVMAAMSRSALSDSSLELPEVSAALRPLRDYLSPCGSIEFHGCQVGGGTRGARFLQRMADLANVPVTAAQTRQVTGNAIRFRGPILSKFPNDSTLHRWARNLPPLRSSRPA
jgi:hypothetical protein